MAHKKLFSKKGRPVNDSTNKYTFSNILSLRFQYGKVKINHLYVSTCDVSYGRACRIFCRIPHKQTSYLHYACARALANGVFSHKICRILAKCRILLNLSFIIRYKAWQSIPLNRSLNQGLLYVYSSLRLNRNQDSLIQFLINQIRSLALNFNYDPITHYFDPLYQEPT